MSEDERRDESAEETEPAPPADPVEPDDQDREAPAARRKSVRRQGCGCLLRLPIYLIVLVVLAVSGLWLWGQSPSAHDAARRMVSARLSEYFGRDVHVGRVGWTVAPLSVEVEDLEIPGTPDGAAGDDDAFAVVPSLSVQLKIERWASWRRPVIDVERVAIQSPRVHLVLREDGTNNLPRFGRGEESSGGHLEVRLGALVVEDGLFRLNDLDVPLDLDARGVVARLVGERAEDGGLVLDGRATAQQVEVTLPDGKPYRFALSARTRIGASSVELQQVDLSGPDLDAHVRGELAIPEEDRRLDLSISARGAVALAEHLGYLDPEIPLSGPFKFDGSFLWRPEGWSAEGVLDSDRLVYETRVLTDVQGSLRVVPDALRYSLDRASYADGVVSGVVRGELGVDRPDYQVDLHLERLALQTIARDQELPLEGIHGRVGGEVSYRFTTDEPTAGSGWADLSVQGGRTPPLMSQGGRTPPLMSKTARTPPLAGQAARTPAAGGAEDGLTVSGQVPIEIDRGTVRIRGTRLAAQDGAQLLELDGSYDLTASTGRFDYRLSSQDVAPLFALIPLDEGGDGAEASGPPAWVPSAGRGEARGVFRLGPAGFTVRSTFDLTGVEAPGLVADRLNGSLRLTPDGLDDLRLEATRQQGALMVLGAIPFGDSGGGGDAADAGTGAASGFHLTIDAASWPGDERLAVWLPFELPLSGPVSGHLQLAGDPDALSGSAHLEVEPATVGDLELDLVIAELRFDPETVTVDRAVLRSGGGELTVGGTVAIAGGALDLHAEAPDLDLDAEPFASALPGDVSGHVALSADARGTLDRPEVTAVVTGTGLVLAGYEVGGDGSARLTVSWRDETLSVEGGIPEVLAISGGGPLTTERADLELHLESDRLGDAVRALAPRVPDSFQGGFSGTLTVSGDFAHPEDLLVRLQAPELNLSLEGHSLQAVEPVVLRATGDGIAVDSLFVREEDGSSELFVQGSVSFDGEMPIDLRTQGSISTAWVKLLLPDLDVEGTFDLLATVGGTLSAPRINGQGELRDGEVIVPDFPQAFENLDAVVLFYPDQIVLDRFQGDVGGGSVRASGRLSLYGDQGPDYRFQASAQNVTLRFPEGIWFRSDAALNLQSTPDGRLVRGTVTLDRAFYVQDIETSLLQILSRALRSERLQVADIDEVSASTQLSLSVQAPGTLRVRNNLADLRGSADLTVRGTAARPVVFGTIEFDPGGTLVYQDTRFEVERARLTFANPARIEPVIDLVASAEIREYDVSLDLSGKVDNLQVHVASDPPLSDLDVLSLLATGQAPARSGLGTTREADQGFSAGGFLAGQAASAVTERVGTLFGFDRFRITPPEGGAGGAGVTVGKRLSKDVVVTYTERSATAEESLLRVEWQVDQHLTLVFSSSDKNAFRVDARWDKRF